MCLLLIENKFKVKTQFEYITWIYFYTHFILLFSGLRVWKYIAVRLDKNARQSIIFAVRFFKTHGKGRKKICFPLGANGGGGRWQKK
jgi:hypothetical protein